MAGPIYIARSAWRKRPERSRNLVNDRRITGAKAWKGRAMVRKISIMLTVAMILIVSPELGNAQGRGGWLRW